MAAKKPRKSKENPPVFAWSAVKEQVALDLAADELTIAKVAEKNGINESTIYEWKRVPDFTARVDAHQAEIWAAIRKHGIAIRENRVRAMNDRWRRMQSVLYARAADPDLAHVPGGDTGLLVHNVKGVGKGDDFQLIDLYEVDTALLRELREHEKQAAQELGQWAERQEISGPGGSAVPISLFEAALKQAYGDRIPSPEGA